MVHTNRHIILTLIIMLILTTVSWPFLMVQNEIFADTKPDVIILTFDPNGGKVKTTQKTYKYNEKTKKLPKPKRSRYVFMGWYTKKSGGKKITAKTKASTLKKDRVIYARWAPTYFMQTDKKWAKKPYGKKKTVRDIGCGPTALSMALYTMGNSDTNPAKACKWSYKHGYLSLDPGRTRDGFYTKYAKKYGVKVTRLNKGDLRKKSKKARAKINKKALDAVKEGNWVIAFMRDSLWAKRGHFILWYDVEGKNALIRDPVTTLPKRAKNKYSLLQKEAVRYWVIEVPDDKKLSPVVEELNEAV